MPDSIYLHKNEKYNTVGIFSAYDDNYILAENDFDESFLEEYVEYIPIYRKDEEVRETQKDLGWHSVDESLPEIDEEVIVLVAPLEVYSSPMKICFGHRPNPDGWDAKSTLTGRKKHYTPETYDGWNIPGVRFWRYALLEQVTPPRSEEE